MRVCVCMFHLDEGTLVSTGCRQDVSTVTGTLSKALLSNAAFKEQQVDSDDSDYEDTKKPLKDSLTDAKLDKEQCSTALKQTTQKLEELKEKAQELHEAALCKEHKVAQVLKRKRKARSSADEEDEACLLLPWTDT